MIDAEMAADRKRLREEGHLRWLRSVVWRADRLSPCGFPRVFKVAATRLCRGQTILCKEQQKERVNIGS